MTHPGADLLYAHIFDDVPLTVHDATHVQDCAECAHLLSDLRSLQTTLAIARHSQPTQAAKVRAQALAATLPKSGVRNDLARVGAWLRGKLVADTRQLAGVGLRGAPGSYRLLFSTEEADIELQIEPTQASRQIEGEVLPLTSEMALAPMLVQMTGSDGATVQEVETDAGGRFHMAGVNPGAYTLWVTSSGAGVDPDILTETTILAELEIT